MKAIVVIVGVLIAARPADACGVPDFGEMLVDVVKAFDPQTEKIETPLVTLGGGTSTDGKAASLGVGYGWGEHDRGGLFPGSALTRVMASVRYDEGEATSVALTYGWYESQIGSAGFDLGVEHSFRDDDTGPIARLTLGLTGGIAARATAGVMFGGEERRVTGQLELVVEVMDLVNRI